MNSLEFMLAFLAFLATVGFAVHAITGINSSFAAFNDSAEALLEAEKCAAIIDSFFANSGGKFSELSLDCRSENGKIVSGKNGTEKTTQAVSRENYVLGDSENQIMVVEVQEHYG